MRRLEMLSTPAERALGRGLPPAGLDDAMLRRLQRAVSRLEPDPLFRRRLRGEIVNRYVASREGLLREPHQRRGMGKLGRAVLYASLMLAMSVSAAGAAAQESLPGDALYDVKLQLEQIRMRIAPPSVQDDLAALALAERVWELETLAEAGSWQLLPAAAARVMGAERALETVGGEAEGLEVRATEHAQEVLRAVLAAAPPSAQEGLSRALQAVGGDGPRVGRPPFARAGNPHRPAAGPLSQPSHEPSREPRSEPSAEPRVSKPAPSQAVPSQAVPSQAPPSQRADRADDRSSRSGSD